MSPLSPGAVFPAGAKEQPVYSKQGPGRDAPNHTLRLPLSPSTTDIDKICKMSNEGEKHKAGLCSRINVLILTQQAQSSLFTV